MGMTWFIGDKLKKADTIIAKNYLAWVYDIQRKSEKRIIYSKKAFYRIDWLCRENAKAIEKQD